MVVKKGWVYKMPDRPEIVTWLQYLRIRQEAQKEKRAAKRYARLRKRGMWYCVYCDQLHGKRVVEYQIADGLVDSVCSLGRDQYLKHNPELADDQQYTPEDFRALVNKIDRGKWWKYEL